MAAGNGERTMSHARPSVTLQRARGRARLGLRCDARGSTSLAGLFQEGCLKVRLPRPQREGHLDAVLINTSGGLTGGDELSVEIALGQDARATVTTPGCERIYRSIGGEARIRHALQVGDGARLDWIPQETILFDRSRLQRRIEIELAGRAEITVAEAYLFGRTAMGEVVDGGFLSDFWTVRREGRLLFADALRMAQPLVQARSGPATLHGCTAMACVVHVGRDLEAKRDALRAAWDEGHASTAGATVIGDVLVARIVAPDNRKLRSALVAALACVREGRPLPRNWLC